MKQLVRFLPFVCIFLWIEGAAQSNTDPNALSKIKKGRTVPHHFNRYDSLRGALSPMRSCYNVFFYNLNLRVNPKDSSIKGYNIIAYRAETDFQRMQIDLFNNLTIRKITHHGKSVAFKRDSNAVFVSLEAIQTKGTLDSIVVHYGGKPHIANSPPWDGGFVWKKDNVSKPWVAVACEGIGASLWWPCKDHLSDEPDSMYINVEVPGDLQAICNGNQRKMSYLKDGFVRYDWRVGYPINTYNVTLNVGSYDHMYDTYTATDGQKLVIDYYVMPYNRGKAERQFKQVKPMLAIYEKYFGKYPFWNDGYALVETPYVGMEHQSAIAYGNDYKNGYQGNDVSGIGLPFDYIIIHESAHEYWGNSVSMADPGELWINESFCTYAESIYVEATYGREKAIAYLKSQAKLIQNTEPILGPLHVNYNAFKTTDAYFKGANMLHTLRHVIDNDSLWFVILKGIQKDFYHKQVHTQDIVNYINTQTGQDYTYFFNQYLKYPTIPVLQCILTQTRKKEAELRYRWTADVPDFAMPVKIALQKDKQTGKPIYQTIHPDSNWQSLPFEGKVEDFRVATELFYIQTDIQGVAAAASASEKK